MRAHRLSPRFIRTIVAAIFGFMSLGHGPVMAFANSGHAGPPQHHAAHAHHSQVNIPADEDTAHQRAEVTDERATHSACYSFGCFTALSTLPDYKPNTDVVPLAKLAPLPPRDITRVFQEPADPPPRLQV